MKGKILVGGKNPTAVSDGEKKNLRLLHPYGIYFVYPTDEAVELDKERIWGSLEPADTELEVGEIMLKSLGGAVIVLKNNGKVMINGREY